MTYRRAVIPALFGGLLIPLLLWWAGESAEALRLRGSTSVLGPDSVNELRSWLAPWSYDPSAMSVDAGAVCAILLGLMASQFLHMAVDDTGSVWGPVYLFSGLGSNVPAALTFGTLAGTAAFAALRLTGGPDGDTVESPGAKVEPVSPPRA